MNALLLDTHVFVWLAYKPEVLGKSTLLQAGNSSMGLYVSVASLLELAFKHGSGKFDYTTAELLGAAHSLNAIILPIEPYHLEQYGGIGLSHKDPFDRLLIAQAQCENLPLLTADQALLDSPYLTIDARK